MKSLSVSTLFIGIMILSSGSVFAASPVVTLPSAGLTPDSAFYFLDRLGENIREFFTFSPEAKANLQIKFAGERISEIKVMVEKSGPKTKGIERAKSLLIANVAQAANIVSQEKASGKDVSILAKSIDDQFDAREKLLTQTFLDARAKLIAERQEIKINLIKEAQASGDTARVAELTKQINDMTIQSNDLKNKKDEIKTAFRSEKKKIEREMDKKDQQNDKKDQEQEDQIEQKEEAEQDETEIEDENKNESEQGKNEAKKEDGQDKAESDSSKDSDKGDNEATKAQENGNQER